jgi:integrase
MLWLGAVGGLRWGEAAGLTVSSLDLLRGTVTVRAQLNRDGSLAPPKTDAGRRTVSLPAWLIEDLAALCGRRGLTVNTPEALLFVNRAGKPLDYTDWRRRTWLPACERAGVVLRFHDLRSWAASALVLSGVDVKTAQARLGHSSPTVTLGIYARAQADADRRAADAVGAVLRTVDPCLTPAKR